MEMFLNWRNRRCLKKNRTMPGRGPEWSNINTDTIQKNSLTCSIEKSSWYFTFQFHKWQQRFSEHDVSWIKAPHLSNLIFLVSNRISIQFLIAQSCPESSGQTTFKVVYGNMVHNGTSEPIEWSADACHSSQGCSAVVNNKGSWNLLSLQHVYQHNSEYFVWMMFTVAAVNSWSRSAFGKYERLTINPQALN